MHGWYWHLLASLENINVSNNATELFPLLDFSGCFYLERGSKGVVPVPKLQVKAV